VAEVEGAVVVVVVVVVGPWTRVRPQHQLGCRAMAEVEEEQQREMKVGMRSVVMVEEWELKVASLELVLSEK
jgi:hypothetical protein